MLKIAPLPPPCYVAGISWAYGALLKDSEALKHHSCCQDKCPSCGNALLNTDVECLVERTGVQCSCSVTLRYLGQQCVSWFESRNLTYRSLEAFAERHLQVPMEGLLQALFQDCGLNCACPASPRNCGLEAAVCSESSGLAAAGTRWTEGRHTSRRSGASLTISAASARLHGLRRPMAARLLSPKMCRLRGSSTYTQTRPRHDPLHRQLPRMQTVKNAPGRQRSHRSN